MTAERPAPHLAPVPDDADEELPPLPLTREQIAGLARILGPAVDRYLAEKRAQTATDQPNGDAA